MNQSRLWDLLITFGKQLPSPFRRMGKKLLQRSRERRRKNKAISDLNTLTSGRNDATVLDLRDERILAEFPEEAETVLDAGFGGGRLLTKCHIDGYEVYGFDISAEYIDLVMKNVSNGNDLNLFRADIQNAPVSENAVDVVVCSEVIEHIPSPKKALEELVHIASKKVIVTTPVGHSFDAPDHIHYFSEADIDKLCSGLQYEVEKILTKPEDKDLNQRAFLITISVQ